jgi:NAD(P)-dependent dehydrogenase (short-subunit alcohol dehydrogenase family)
VSGARVRASIPPTTVGTTGTNVKVRCVDRPARLSNTSCGTPGTGHRNPLCGTGHAQCGQGSIINISSISGKVGVVGQTNYSAAKAGIVGLTKVAAKELGHLGVRVNAIQPGLIRTAMTDALPDGRQSAESGRDPDGRAGEPVEVGKVALFLASDLSSYITGAVLEVTGGRNM